MSVDSSVRPRARQRASHRALLNDVTSSVAPGRPGRVDAIVVPSGRKAEALWVTAELAAAIGTLLVVLGSHQNRAAEAAEVVARTPRCRGVLIDVPADYEHDYLKFETGAEIFKKASAGRCSDLGPKRSLALLLARLQGWRKILFVDDDVFGLTSERVGAIARQLDSSPVAGLRLRRFPDNSVVCHANRARDPQQDVFVSGAVLGVNTSDQPLPFFPDIYNEDWLFFSDLAWRRQLPLVGEARQRRFNPFHDSSRAAREEFGDLLAEGLYAWMGERPWYEGEHRPALPGRSYWGEFIEVRRQLIYDITRDLSRNPTNENTCAITSLKAAREQHSGINPELCADFLNAWQDDRSVFEATAMKLSDRGSLEAALDELQLNTWRIAHYGNPDAPKIRDQAPVRLRK